MSAPILFVAGLGRCGTTMVMHMLWRGGFPVAGDPPAFETDNMQMGHVNYEWLREQSGRAVKWIDPLHARIDFDLIPSKPVVIWLSRDFKEQARSQIKLLGQFTDRNAVRAMARSIAEDTHRAQRRLSGLGTRYFPMEFERILSNPKGAAAELGYIVTRYFGVWMPRTDGSFDSDLAARAVVSRWPECAPDLSIELDLMNKYPGDAVHE